MKDFSPYIAKIKASGADTVLTGNWGNDLSLLVKAGKEAGLVVNYYALYAYIVGSPTAIGESGAESREDAIDLARECTGQQAGEVRQRLQEEVQRRHVVHPPKPSSTCWSKP